MENEIPLYSGAADHESCTERETKNLQFIAPKILNCFAEMSNENWIHCNLVPYWNSCDFTEFIPFSSKFGCNNLVFFFCENCFVEISHIICCLVLGFCLFNFLSSVEARERIPTFSSKALLAVVFIGRSFYFLVQVRTLFFFTNQGGCGWKGKGHSFCCALLPLSQKIKGEFLRVPTKWRKTQNVFIFLERWRTGNGENV